MHPIKFFIIIPIYNVESYLHQCLDSILEQTYTNFDAILVNDGSTDSSEKIAQEYVSKDQRFMLFSQENQGLSGARNSGLEIVQSKWETLKERMLSRHWENSLTSSCDSNICWVLGLSISFNSNAVQLLIEGESFWNPSNATNSSFYQKLLSDLLLFIL